MKNKRIENRKENQNKIVEFRHTITILTMLAWYCHGLPIFWNDFRKFN